MGNVVFDFNPRSREGSDLLTADRQAQPLQISIHAPAKGATTLPLPPIYGNFNPRSREGSDQLSPTYNTDHIDFNPRSREGSDAMTQNLLLRRLWISIHAPAKGATYRSAAKDFGFVISIHAPAKGATRKML